MPSAWVERGLLAYAAALPLRRVLVLPGVGNKVQLPELIFLLLFPLVIWAAGRRWWPATYRLTLAWAVLIGIAATAALHAHLTYGGATGSLLEVAGRGYLFLVLLTVAWYVRERGEAGVGRLLTAWSWGCVILAVVGYLGYGLALGGVDTRWVMDYENYPYFGTVFRATGTAGNPIALVLVTLLPFLWQWRRWRRGAGGGWFLLLLAPLLLLTLAKEVLLVLMGVWLTDPRVGQRPRWLRYAPVLVGALGLWTATHYLVGPPRSYTPAELAGVVFTGGRTAGQLGPWQFTETSYLALKRANWQLATEYPWLGVGPNETERYLPELKRRGVYPGNLPVYRPHSTWFGALSEMGWPGLLALLWVAVALGRVLAANLRLRPTSDTAHCLAAFFLLIAIASVSEEFLGVRYVHVAAGMALGLYHLNDRPDAP